MNLSFKAIKTLCCVFTVDSISLVSLPRTWNRKRRCSQLATQRNSRQLWTKALNDKRDDNDEIEELADESEQSDETGGLLYEFVMEHNMIVIISNGTRRGIAAMVTELMTNKEEEGIEDVIKVEYMYTKERIEAPIIYLVEEAPIDVVQQGPLLRSWYATSVHRLNQTIA